MKRVGRTGRAAASILATVLLVAGLVPGTLAVNVGPDKAEVVIVLDFSASILNDEASRNRFGEVMPSLGRGGRDGGAPPTRKPDGAPRWWRPRRDHPNRPLPCRVPRPGLEPGTC